MQARVPPGTGLMKTIEEHGSDKLRYLKVHIQIGAPVVLGFMFIK